jgi:hypothetical protein
MADMKKYLDGARERDKRNLNPHKAAVAAMYLWGAAYSRQNGGSMDFWDSLRESDKETCRSLVKAIEKARKE